MMGPETARRELAASLVAGIAHDLNGRLAALLGVAHLARTSTPMDDELLSVLDDQIHRLRDSVLLLRAVPISDPRAAVRGVPLSEAVFGAVRLYRCRSGPDVATVQIEQTSDEGPLVNVVPPALTEALLLGMAAVERTDDDAPGAIGIVFGENGDGPFVRISRLRDADGGLPFRSARDAAAVTEAAAQRMKVAGGRVAHLRDGALEFRFD